jgi:two-component system cell cycle sensor histidine kinase/response regulator CckA
LLHDVLGAPARFTDFVETRAGGVPLADILVREFGVADDDAENIVEVVRIADGSLIVLDATFGPLRDAEGRVVQVVASGVDVTARKQAEAQRQKLEAQLWQAQKMEALGTLAGGVAHDFNNILSAISGNTELARQDLPPGSPVHTSLGEIRKATRRAKSLVQQILAFSRKQPTEQRVLALKPVIEECAAMLRATLPTTIELRVECADDAPNVLADATQIQQVLLNLGTNAWHALGNAPGRIDVKLELAAIDTDSGDLHAGRYACVAVSDTGCGMSDHTLARIFEPFYTTKEVGEGTGLGLSVVDGIVKRHGGTVRVASQLNVGSTFRIFLPANAGAASNHQATTRLLAPRGHGQRILYLDDDDALVLLASRILERQGYVVSGFTVPSEALAAFRAAPASFDLAITDYTMPGTTGVQVAKQLMSIRSDIPVMLTSGYVTDELNGRAHAEGVRYVVYKPDTVDELCRAVHQAIAEGGIRRSG